MEEKKTENKVGEMGKRNKQLGLRRVFRKLKKNQKDKEMGITIYKVLKLNP